VGTACTLKESEVLAARDALAAIAGQRAPTASPAPPAPTPPGGAPPSTSLSFRGAATKLPFPLRFQLERCLLNNEAVPLTIARQPHGRPGLKRRGAVQQQARRLVEAFIEHVLPPLLAVPWHQEDGLVGHGRTFTCIEVFAEEVWERLNEVKVNVRDGQRVTFGHATVDGLLARARATRAAAEARHGMTEQELGAPAPDRAGRANLIKKRASW